MTDQQQDNVFIPQPLSVHGWTAEAFKDWFWRRNARHIIAFGSAFMAVAIGQGIIRDGFAWEYLWAAPVGVIGGLLVGVLIISVKCRFQCRVALSTTFELWPESLVFRTAGTPRVTIQPEDVVSVRYWEGRGGNVNWTG